MKTDGLFTTHSFKITAKLNQPFRLVFFGDVHRDAPLFALDDWRHFLEHSRKLKDAYFIGMGDYLDSTSTSERAILGAAAFHESTLGDLQELAAQKVKLLGKELAFMKGHLIGLVNGNHYFGFSNGSNSDMELCRLLECKYLGVSCFIRLAVECQGRHSSLIIWAHHGAGAARLIGGSLNRVEQMREHADADIYAMGHDHKRGVVPSTPRLHLVSHSRGGLALKARPQWVIRSGSFLNSYEPGKRSYNVDAARGPCSIGHVELLVTPRVRTVDGARTQELEIHGLA